MQCTACHEAPELQRWLLRRGCAAEPQLKVEPRDWFPPRGWGGSTATAPRALVVLATNPGHPLPTEVAQWDGFPSTVASAKQLTTQHAQTELALVAAIYRDGVAGRTAFHTRSVQVARAALFLLREASKSLNEPWFDNVWFSDVVKCSTAKEMGSPGIPNLAGACGKHLLTEVRILRPSLIVTLGAGARAALDASGAQVPARVDAIHPQAHEWRTITSAAHDGWLQSACQVLGVQWAQVRGRLADVRAALQANAWCDLGGRF